MTLARRLLLPLTMLAVVAPAAAAEFARLPPEHLDAAPPTARVSGTPGRLTLVSRQCRGDIPDSQIRRRIVDIAVQEWAYFGFRVVDETRGEADPPGFSDVFLNDWFENPEGLPRRLPPPGPDEVLRTATSVAGYWAVTAEGAWIVERQDRSWNGPGTVVRWRDPWSAAFISWVMCEAGLDSRQRFERAVAHHRYIDQAIRARDRQLPDSAYVAYDVGERAVLPGDLVCAGRRPAYRTLAERRRQLGTGARTHCDIVVGVDVERERILAIGGNVRGNVGLKLLPAERRGDGTLRPLTQSSGERFRPVFAHLQLRTEAIEPDALATTPTMRALRCMPGYSPPPQLAAAELGVATRGATC